MDSLRINKASFLGWSMGGNEISEFAIQYTERTNKLIYLEAGYDLSEDPFKAIHTDIPRSPFPDSADLSFLEAYRKWYHSFWFPDIDWNPVLEANLKASVYMNVDDRVSTLPDDKISNILLESAMMYHRDYSKLEAPALAIYTTPFFCSPPGDSNLVRLYDNHEKNIIAPWRRNNMSRIKKELKNVTIIEAPKGSHDSLIFLSKDFLVNSINDFLLN